MEVDEIEAKASKFSRADEGSRIDPTKLAKNKGTAVYYPYTDPEDADAGRMVASATSGGGGASSADGLAELGGDRGVVDTINQLRGWHHSSRIIRVSRASGGKDRHSKVWTAKGPRDRRVRLSVTTAIQFYDLQDRLGYDQPSKAVEWLIKAAAHSIAELPALSSHFPETPRQLSDERRPTVGGAGAVAAAADRQGQDSADQVDLELEGDQPNFAGQNHNQHRNASSASDTSKGSGSGSGSGTGCLSLSRSEIRVKARERARERASKENMERDQDESKKVNKAVALPVPVPDRDHLHHQNPLSQSSFTQLLTGGIDNLDTTNGVRSGPPGGGESGLFQKPARQWQAMDYFRTGLMSPSSSSKAADAHSSTCGFAGLGNPVHQGMFGQQGHHNPDLQHFAFSSDHYISEPTHAMAAAAATAGSDYNLNVAISSAGLAVFSRGTLQSNSPSYHHQHQRFSTLNGSAMPFFLGEPVPPVENHHHHHHNSQFPATLQLCYTAGDGGLESDEEGKGKS